MGAIVAFVLLYSIPQAMITAELSTAFPDNGGYSLWVNAAFGDFWAVQESYWSWFGGVVDSALYPVLMYSTTMQLVEAWRGRQAGGSSHKEVFGCLFHDAGCVQEYVAKLLITCAFAMPNVISSTLVGMGVTALGILVMMPYAVMSAIGLPQVIARLRQILSCTRSHNECHKCSSLSRHAVASAGAPCQLASPSVEAKHA